MTFVDYDDIRQRKGAALQGLDACHLHRHPVVGQIVIGLHDTDVLNAFGLEYLHRLVHQIDRGNDKGHPGALFQIHLEQIG